MIADPRAPDPVKFEAGAKKLARGSRWAGVISIVGLLLVLVALVLSGRELAETSSRVAALNRENERLAQQIGSKRSELRLLTDSLVRTREAYSAYRDEVRRREPVLAAEAAQVARDSAAAARVVYIQFRGTFSRELANQLRGALNRSGYIAPGVERIDREFGNSVRYFREADAEAARDLGAQAEAFLASKGCKLELPPRDHSSRGAGVPAGQMEIWVNANCSTVTT